MTEDRILIRDLVVRGVIGVHELERKAPQEIVINLELVGDVRTAAKSDQLADALDYHAVSRAVIDYVTTARHGLVETFAEGIARICVVDFGVVQATVRVEKPTALSEARAVGVEIVRRRADFAG